MKNQIQIHNHKAQATIPAHHGDQTNSSARRLFAALLTLAVILATFNLTSCVGVTKAGSAGNPGSGAGVLSASATSLSFGNVAVGSNKTQSITLTNTGTATVNISEATITGAGYTVVNGKSLSISAGQSGTLQIQMAPASAGILNGTLSIASDATNSHLAVELIGTGTEPVLAVTPGGTLQFGNVNVGQTMMQPVMLKNGGNVDLVLSAARITGVGFTMNGLTLPSTITAGKTTTFNVMFSPSTPQGSTGSIKFSDNAPNSTQSLDLTGTGTGANSALTATPGSVSFGNVTVGQNSSQVVTLTNSGSTAIAISQAVESGPGFSIGSLSTTSLNAGQTAIFTATFAPTATGSATGSVTITSNASNPTLTVSLVGVGTQPHLGASPSAVNFGSIAVGSSSLASVTLTNTGSGAVNVSSGSATGAGFSMSGLTPITLNSGQSTSFNVRFAPTASGNATGNITIQSDAPNSPVSISLSGTATQSQPGLSINPTNVPFGNVAVGSSTSQNVTLTNTGNAVANITGASVSGTGFGLSGLTTASINPGASLSFSASFAPTTAGTSSGSISIASNAPGSPATITLSGSGIQGALSASPASSSFGIVSTGSSNSQTITLSNTGSAPLAISQASVSGAGFSISGLAGFPITINPGANKAFNVVFAPTSNGAVTGNILVTSNAPNSPLSIALSGTGQAAMQLLSANPSNLNFANVNEGSNSSLTVTLTNTGNSNVTITSATASGAGFSATGVNGTTLTPNQTATLTVTFAPTSAGAVSGSVAVNSNASNSPMISLSGTGVQQTQHSVSLNWASSTSTDVVGYNIYRGTVSGGPYSILDSAPVAADAYNDATVQSEKTYFYVVRSVDNTGMESTNSSEVSAVIP